MVAAYENLTRDRRLKHIYNLCDFELRARKLLPKALAEYVFGGVEDNTTLANNRRQFDDHTLLTRVLSDVSSRHTAHSLLGQTYAAPFGIAPVGVSALIAFNGDNVMASAAYKLGIPMILSGSSLTRLEEVKQHHPQVWFQAYLPGQPDLQDALIERVAAAGIDTLVITVDIPVWANRENNMRAGFSLPLRPSLSLLVDGLLHPRWSLGTFWGTLQSKGMPHFENSFATRGAPVFSSAAVRDTTGRDHINWAHIARIRRLWQGKLIIKGVLSVNDARLSQQYGADGIIVSNHGGRQLDTVTSPLQQLPLIRQAVGPGYVVMMDSGIRRGTDVIKALALGADFVFTGRPFISAATVAGVVGVEHAIALLQQEVERDMGMLGINHIADINRECLA